MRAQDCPTELLSSVGRGGARCPEHCGVWGDLARIPREGSRCQAPPSKVHLDPGAGAARARRGERRQQRQQARQARQAQQARQARQALQARQVWRWRRLERLEGQGRSL